MKTRIPPLLFLAILMLVAGCAADKSKPYDPFLVPKTTIRQDVKTIGLLHTQMQYAVDTDLIRLIEARLRTAGFNVVEPGVLKPIADREQHALGGLFNPETGEADKEKTGTYWKNVSQQFKTNFNVDALMLFAIEQRKIEYHGKSAWDSNIRWDGTSEQIFVHDNFLDKLTSGTDGYGTTYGYSLKVVLSDLQQRDLYVNYGGIQLAAKVQSPNVFASKVVQLPDAQLFTDTNRVQNAVNIALDPLVR